MKIIKTNSMSRYPFLCIVSFAFLFSACGLINEKNKGKGVNLFSVAQDKELGAQVAAEIEMNTAQ